MSASQRADEAIAANPGKSDRAIAAEIGVSDKTVGKARKRTADQSAVEKRVGKDGKARKLPERQQDESMRRPDDDEKRRIYKSAALEAREIFDRYHSSTKKIRDQVWQLIVLANADGERNPSGTRNSLNIPWAQIASAD